MDISLTKEEKQQVIDYIQNYFELERGEEIGNLGADQFYEFLMKEIGPYIYNKGVKDAKKMLEQKMMNLEEDIASLEKPTYRQR
ncbi:DUF2164 family protein [Pontibacillus yanchengensis]|uniref:DUF2164 family protein n=2 Tax=Pontibacillus yanchengensis TaxID=462910 RepID=A0ACC7VLZ2_9BACI|nr:DUF2164 family protein [Pontibacillus yanchengensis]MYL55244.1 DUF2164 family protein [Pontibacillus yanchengensis]